MIVARSLGGSAALALAMLVLVGSGLATAGTSPVEARVQAVCARVGHSRPPAADLPSKAARQALKGCDAQAMLFGIGRPRDAAGARRCAFVQMSEQHGEQVSGHGDLGGAVLAMIYGNGDGVARNIDLARRYLCHPSVFASTMDLESWFGRLDAIDRTHARFDPCDQVMSSAWTGSCAQRATRISSDRRSREAAALSRRWSPAARAALKALLGERDRFLDARANEVDRGGLLANARIQADRDRVEAEAHGLLRRLARPGAFSSTPAALAASDRRLNSVYRRVMAIPVEPDALTVQPSDIRTSERAWIRYRDAWLALARILGRSRAERDGLAQTVTDQRTAQLECSVAVDNRPDNCLPY